MKLFLTHTMNAMGKHDWRWQLVSPNGKIVAASCEGFTRKEKCRNNAVLTCHGLDGNIAVSNPYKIIFDNETQGE